MSSAVNIRIDVYFAYNFVDLIAYFLSSVLLDCQKKTTQVYNFKVDLMVNN